MSTPVPMGIPVPMGVAEVTAPPQLLQIRGLGSCIALALLDREAKVAGLAHTVIPRPLARSLPHPAWASSEAPALLARRMEEAGAERRRIVARIAGGASMFAAHRRGFNVGEENRRAVEAALADLGIPLLSRRVGGTSSRNVLLDPATGVFRVEEAEAVLAPRGPGLRPRSDTAADEVASVLLHAAVAPLATLLDRPIGVEEARAFVVPTREIPNFLGEPDDRVWYALSAVDRDGTSEPVGVFVPRAHATALADAVRALSETAEPDEAIVPEMLNLVTAHAVTALARLAGSRMQMGAPLVGEDPARAVAAEARALTMGRPRVMIAYGRAYAEEVLRGAEVALLVASEHAPATA